MIKPASYKKQAFLLISDSILKHMEIYLSNKLFTS